MRITLWIVAALWLLGGIIGDVKATNALHQILAQIDYLIAAVFIIGAEIIGSISARDHPQIETAAAPAPAVAPVQAPLPEPSERVDLSSLWPESELGRFAIYVTIGVILVAFLFYVVRPAVATFFK